MSTLISAIGWIHVAASSFSMHGFDNETATPHPAVGMVHSVVMLAFIILLMVFLRRRKKWLPDQLTRH